MDRRFATVLGISFLFALLVSGLFYRITQKAKGGEPGAPVPQRALVVAARSLSVGATVQAEDLKLVQVPAAAFPKGGFTKIEEVAGRPVISNILLEEPVLEGRLAERGSGVGLAPVIPAGMRAVSVRVTDVVGVAGFVQPGLRVDVLVTGRPPNALSTMTQTVLQNILVLSSGTTLAADARGQAINAPSVTLLVTPEQAEILTLASNEGRIQLVLRNSRDEEIRPTPGTSIARLYGVPEGGRGVGGPSRGHPEEPLEAELRPRFRPRSVASPTAGPLSDARPAAAPPSEQIVVIRGDKRTLETVMRARDARPGTPVAVPTEPASAPRTETPPPEDQTPPETPVDRDLPQGWATPDSESPNGARTAAAANPELVDRAKDARR